jgi:hypothetical protein
LVYFKETHFNYLNSYLTKSKRYNDSKYLINFDSLIQDRFYPACEFKEERVELTKDDGTKEEKVVSKSLFFISFDTIINRFQSKDSVFKSLIEVYDKQSIIYFFKIFQEPDFIRIAKNIEVFNNFYHTLNIKEDIEIMENESGLGKGEAKKNFEEILLYAIKHNVSDIYLVKEKVAHKDVGRVTIRNSHGELVTHKTFSGRKFTEMVNVVMEDAKIDKSQDPDKPKKGKHIAVVKDLAL